MKQISCESDLNEVSSADDIELTNDIFLTNFDSIESFSGFFEGNGYTIHNLDSHLIKNLTESAVLQNICISNVSLEISEDENCGGIFKENKGRIRSISVENVSSPYKKIFSGGIIVGENTEGSIKNCSVKNCSVENASYIGGIVGIGYQGEIVNCTVSNVNFSGDRVGGICAISKENRIYKCQCYDSSLRGDSMAGGIAGTSSNSTLRKNDVVYSRVRCGSTNSDSRTGGIIGASIKSTITEVGIVSTLLQGRSMCGGVIGESESGDISNVLIMHSSIEELSPESNIDLVVGRTESDLKNLINIYVKKSTIDNKYVNLCRDGLYKQSEIDICANYIEEFQINHENISNSVELFSTKSKQKPNTICITDASDLEEIDPSDTVILNSDIHISKKLDITPIFYGQLNGNGHTISGLKSPLFEFLYGRIANLTIKRVRFDTNYTKSKGILVVKNNGLISNVNINNVKIDSVKTNSFSGISGTTYSGKIENCTVSITVSEHLEYFSGITGMVSEDSIVKNCTANIRGKCSTGGGISIMIDSGSIINCESQGEINETDSVGAGIVSKVFGGHSVYDNKIQENQSQLKIKGSVCGGIVGVSKRESFICKNSFQGELECEVGGGVIGKLYSNSIVKNCINNGTVTGNIIGGIIGIQNSKTILEKSYNDGILNSEKTCGGLIGELKKGGVKDCYNTGLIKSGEPINPVIGETLLEDISCENIYWVPQQENVQYSQQFGECSTKIKQAELKTIIFT